MSNSRKLMGQKMRRAFAQLRNLPQCLRLLWNGAGKLSLFWLILLLVQGLLPALLVFLTKEVVDGVVGALRSTNAWTGMRDLWPLGTLLIALLLLYEIVSALVTWLRSVQSELLRDHITALIHQKSATVDYAFYELAAYYDHLHRARNEATYRPAALIENIGALLQNSVTLVALAAILIPMGPWLALVLFLSTIPALFVAVRFAFEEYEWRLRITADERRSWYYEWLVTTSEAAAELRLFGLGQYFQEKYTKLRARLRRERFRLLARQKTAELIASVLAVLITSAAMLLMLWRTVNGQLTIGALALLYVAFSQGQKLMRTLLDQVGQVYANSLFLESLFDFLKLEPSVKEVEDAKAIRPTRVKHKLAFENVSFRYPDTESRTLQNFDLKIDGGTIVALVGPNGAGKSTLVKLLCRFYDPDQGAITIDGNNLKDIPIAHLRRLITVLFQQPLHYNATLRENVSYGDLQLGSVDSELMDAINAAGAGSIVAGLPDGYDTLLGKWFNGGAELSVGEWQRIALARAFLRKAPIMILDEPTSALDPWAETSWLTNFRQLATGRTSIIITHRFTTAMHADIIHVMHDGEIVESGNHEQLLANNGYYADSWVRQMNAARTPIVVEDT